MAEIPNYGEVRWHFGDARGITTSPDKQALQRAKIDEQARSVAEADI